MPENAQSDASEKGITRLSGIASVELEAWAEVNHEYCLEEFFHSPYALAGRAVVEGVMEWANRKYTRLPQFIFEDGDKGWEGLVKLCSRLNVVPTRLPKPLAWLGRGLAPYSAGSAYPLLPVSSGSASRAKP
jgi:hypothetical protein